MTLKKFITCLLSGTLALASIVQGAPITVQAEETIKVGANYETSGEAASYGQQMVEGLELAIKQANEAGGLLGGQSVEAVIYDNKSDTTEAATLAQRLVSEDVVGIVGPALTATSNAQKAITNEAGVPTVSPSASVDDYTLDDSGNVLEYVFRVCFWNSYQAEVGATFAADNLGTSKAALIVDNGSDYSTDLAEVFEETFTEKGGEIVTEQNFSAGDTDFSAILTTILSSDIDVIYIPAYYTEAGLIIKQAREMGIDAPIVGADGMSSEVLVELAGAENATNVHYSDHFSQASEEPIVQEFMTAFDNEYGKEASTFNALGYDAAILLFDAIERAGSTDRDAVRDQLAATEDFEGVTGTFSIDENHNPIKSAVMISLEKGEIANAINVTAEQ